MSCCDDDDAVANVDFDASRNEAFVANVTFQPLNLTGYAARMQIRPFAGSPTAYVTITTAAPTPNGSLITINSATDASSELTLLIAQADLATIPETKTPPAGPDCWVYDLLLIDPTGIPQVYLSGKFFLSFGVTQPT